MPSPALRIASMPELLETILEQVDMRTLIISAQRVCRGWNVLIATSLPLQRALFFHPIIISSADDIIDQRRFNPLLVEEFPLFYREFATSHPAKLSSLMASGENSLFGHMDTLSTCQPVASIGLERRASFLYKSASWRRMLVQQPACPKIGIIERRFPVNCRYYTGILPVPPDTGGLTMGILYDLVYKYVGNPSIDARFFVHWRVQPSPDTGLEHAPYEAYSEDSNLLRYLDPDAGVALMLETVSRPLDPRHPYAAVPQASSIDELESKYRPEGMELHEVEMIFRFDDEEAFVRTFAIYD